MSPIALLVALLFPLALASAQSRHARTLTSEDRLPSPTSDAVFVDDDGWVSVAFDTPAGRTVTDFTSGVTLPGAYLSFPTAGSAPVSDVLVAGRRGAFGRVERWSFNNVTLSWALHSFQEIVNADFTGIAHDGARLYILDCISNTVLMGNWALPNKLGDVSFGVWATTSEVPSLSEASRESIAYLPVSSAPGLTGAGLFLWKESETQGVKHGILIQGTGGAVSGSPFKFDRMPGPARAVALEVSAVAGQSSMRVATNGPDAVSIVRDGQTIGLATGGASGGEVAVLLSESLVLGDRYEVHTAGVSGISEFWCKSRMGFPEVLTGDTSIGHLHPQRYVVSNSGFAIFCNLRRRASAASSDYSGVMIAGLDTNVVVPFDNGQGTNSLLISDYWFGVTGFVDEGEFTGFVRMDLPIPNDPGLAGMLLQSQFAITDGTEFRLSDVVGFVIQPSP